MFKGIYHGKQAHPPDLPAVLARAWEAGVERIIVRHLSLMTLATHSVPTRVISERCTHEIMSVL